MKKVLPIAILGIAAAATACVSYASYNDKPEYLQAAETRVGSYLTSDYGRISCTSTKINDARWGLQCLNAEKGTSFEFTVAPADKAPYAVSRSFYLEAVNDNAKQSVEQGLMRYLQVNTTASVSQS